MEFKTYSTASNARRAAKVFAKFEDVTAEPRQIEDGHIVVVTVDHNHPECLVVQELAHAKGFSLHITGKVTTKKSSGYISESSDHQGVCAEVHQLCDDMLAANPDVKRNDIIEAARERGIAYGTVRTQYQRWKAKRA